MASEGTTLGAAKLAGFRRCRRAKYVGSHAWLNRVSWRFVPGRSAKLYIGMNFSYLEAGRVGGSVVEQTVCSRGLDNRRAEAYAETEGL
jgi:hypothetical protein